MSIINISCDTLFAHNSSIFRWMICTILFFSSSLSMTRMEMQNFAICPISLDCNYIDIFLSEWIKIVFICLDSMHICNAYLKDTSNISYIWHNQGI